VDAAGVDRSDLTRLTLLVHQPRTAEEAMSLVAHDLLTDGRCGTRRRRVPPYSITT
jgi:hypothetical protein